MSDRPGLSIFDDDNGKDDRNDATQVIPVPGAGASSSASAASATRTGLPPIRNVPTFPVVRRGGYDTAAVDREVNTLAGENAGLKDSLEQARSRAQTLERRVAELEAKVKEAEQPTYAGLGGRASEMLRLAEALIRGSAA